MSARRASLAAARAAALVLCLGSFAAPSGPGLQELRAVLRRRSADDGRTPAELASELGALGPAAVPALYDLVTGRALDALVGETWLPEDWCCTPEQIPELCAVALERAPTAAVVERLARALDDGPASQERLVQLRILAGQGSADGLALVLRNAAELGDVELARPRARGALRAALVSILRRDRRSWTRIEKRLDELGPAAREVLVEAMGEAGRRQGMGVLVRLLAGGQPARTRIVEAMARLEVARPWDLGGQTMPQLAPLLRSPDPAERALAARLTGELHALERVPDLIELVGDTEPSVSRCAANALALMAQQPLGSDARVWEGWYQRERAWKDACWGSLFETLVSARPGPANGVLRELALHPLYRHEGARAIAESLGAQPRAAALAACAELESLGSRWALPGLVRALEEAHPQLRAAAWRALRKLTGEERELSLELWRGLVDS